MSAYERTKAKLTQGDRSEERMISGEMAVDWEASQGNLLEGWMWMLVTPRDGWMEMDRCING